MTLDNLTDLAETTAMEICVTTNHDTSRMPQLARASGSRLAYACFRSRASCVPRRCSRCRPPCSSAIEIAPRRGSFRVQPCKATTAAQSHHASIESDRINA